MAKKQLADGGGPPPIAPRGGAPSIPRRAKGPTQAEVDAMNAEAQAEADAMNADALAQHRREVEQAEAKKLQFEAELRDEEARKKRETELKIKQAQASYKPPARPKFIVARVSFFFFEKKHTGPTA